jgi:hypothetical protein
MRKAQGLGRKALKRLEAGKLRGYEAKKLGSGI